MALSIVKNDHENNKKIPNPFSWISSLGKIEKIASHSVSYSAFGIRNLVTSAVVNSSRPWLLETPAQIRAYAAFEFHDRYKTCMNNLKSKKIKHFDMKFKTKKKFRWTMDVPKNNIYLPRAGYDKMDSDKNFKDCINRYDICKIHNVKDYLGNIVEENVSQNKCSTCKFLPQNQFMLYRESGWIKTTEKLDNTILESDSQIHFDGQYYYILIPYKKKELKVNDKSNWFCSL